MALSDLGEFNLISRLTADLPTREGVAVGVGDDAAVLDCAAGFQLVATCDAQVEGVHFLPSAASPQQIGRRALAVNLSDVAAMGGEPLFALVSLVLVPHTTLDWLDGLYEGLRAAAAAHNMAVVGGNIASSSGPLVLDITVIGRVPHGQAVLRAGAREGDRIYVTGTLGAAAAGLLSLTGAPQADSASSAQTERVRAAYLEPVPRVKAGQLLAATGALTAMLDISDGLAADLHHLCSRSHVGATVEAARIPLDPATEAVARSHGRDPLALALHGGEDYQLLFSAPADEEPAILAALAAAGESATAIGRLTRHACGLRLQAADGSTAPLEPRGWDHVRAVSGSAG